jgi:hypothetical protein
MPCIAIGLASGQKESRTRLVPARNTVPVRWTG